MKAPVELSMNAFCIGLPDSMKSGRIPLLAHQARNQRDRNSRPLSPRILCGRGYRSRTFPRAAVTLRPLKDVSVSMARHPHV